MADKPPLDLFSNNLRGQGTALPNNLASRQNFAVQNANRLSLPSRDPSMMLTMAINRQTDMNLKYQAQNYLMLSNINKNLIAINNTLKGGMGGTGPPDVVKKQLKEEEKIKSIGFFDKMRAGMEKFFENMLGKMNKPGKPMSNPFSLETWVVLGVLLLKAFNFPKLIGTAIDFFKNAYKELKDFGTRAWGAIKDFGLRAGTSIANLATRGLRFFSELGTKGLDIFRSLRTSVVKTIDNLATRGLSYLSNLKDRAYVKFGEMGHSMEVLRDKGILKLEELGMKAKPIWERMAKGAESAGKATSKFMGEVGSGIKIAFKGVLTFFSGLGNGIMGFFNGLGSTIIGFLAKAFPNVAKMMGGAKAIITGGAKAATTVGKALMVPLDIALGALDFGTGANIKNTASILGIPEDQVTWTDQVRAGILASGSGTYNALAGGVNELRGKQTLEMLSVMGLGDAMNKNDPRYNPNLINDPTRRNLDSEGSSDLSNVWKYNKENYGYKDSGSSSNSSIKADITGQSSKGIKLADLAANRNATNSKGGDLGISVKKNNQFYGACLGNVTNVLRNTDPVLVNAMYSKYWNRNMANYAAGFTSWARTDPTAKSKLNEIKGLNKKIFNYGLMPGDIIVYQPGVHGHSYSAGHIEIIGTDGSAYSDYRNADAADAKWCIDNGFLGKGLSVFRYKDAKSIMNQNPSSTNKPGQSPSLTAQGGAESSGEGTSGGGGGGSNLSSNSWHKKQMQFNPDIIKKSGILGNNKTGYSNLPSFIGTQPVNEGPVTLSGLINGYLDKGLGALGTDRKTVGGYLGNANTLIGQYKSGGIANVLSSDNSLMISDLLGKTGMKNEDALGLAGNIQSGLSVGGNFISGMANSKDKSVLGSLSSGTRGAGKGLLTSAGLGELAPILDVAPTVFDMISGINDSADAIGAGFSGDTKRVNAGMKKLGEQAHNNPISNWINEQILGKDWYSKQMTGTTASGLPPVNPKIIENQIMKNQGKNTTNSAPIVIPVATGNNSTDHSVSKSMDINDIYLMTALTGGLD